MTASGLWTVCPLPVHDDDEGDDGVWSHDETAGAAAAEGVPAPATVKIK